MATQLTRIETIARLTEALEFQDEQLTEQILTDLLGKESALKSIAAMLVAVMRTQVDQTALLQKIEQELNAPASDEEPVSAHVVAIQIFDLKSGKEVFMAQNLMNDVKSVLHVVFDNLAGTAVTPPAAGQIAVSLVDAAGAPSTLGTAVVGSPDGSGMDGSKVTVSPNLPAGSSLGAATLKYDDTINGGTPADISFSFDIMFIANPDAGAASAHVDPATIETFPL